MQLSLPAQSALLSADFTFGVATASFQIEGAADTRLPCIWDTFCATDGKIKDGSDGKQACNHVRLWEEDVELIHSLGVDAYRLSLSWPRVLTESAEINTSGVDFYLRLLDKLNYIGIRPFVTLYHWDLPQYLEDKGGWLNRETAYRFADYADKISRALGDRVFSYATLNEPFCSAYLGYQFGIHAPGHTDKNYGKKAAHHLLLGHGLAMQALASNSPEAQNGIVLNFTPCYPASDTQEDKVASDIADQHFNQWFIKPLFDKSYPDILDSLPQEQRPEIQDGDMDIIAEPLDYLGVNYYTRAIYKADPVEQFVQVAPPEPLTDIGWEIYPQAMTNLLTSLHETYSLPPIYITENGAAMDDQLEHGKVADKNRIDYLQQHLLAVDKAIAKGVDIRGYFAWSLMDNFEWAEGYTKRFGIVYVDYLSQTRTIKNSGIAYRDLISGRNALK